LDGKTYKGTSPFSTLRVDKYKLNDTVEIFVNKKKPGQYRFKGKNGVLFLFAGAIITAIGLLFVILYFI